MKLIVLSALLGIPMMYAQDSYQCRGEEPFWGARLNENTAVLTRPGTKTVSEQVYRGKLVKLPAPGAEWLVFRGKEPRSGSVLTLALRAEECHSTMPDEGGVGTHRAVVTFANGNSAMGCCTVQRRLDLSKAPEADFGTKPAEDWTKLLPDLMPAVRACLLDSGVLGETVVRAWPMNRGKAGVRMAEKSGRQWDCVADLGMGPVGRVEGRVKPAVHALPASAKVIFWPVREAPPAIFCGRVEKVKMQDGSLAGYLQYDPCGQ